jgi:hypothetical protein
MFPLSKKQRTNLITVFISFKSVYWFLYLRGNSVILQLHIGLENLHLSKIDGDDSYLSPIEEKVAKIQKEEIELIRKSQAENKVSLSDCERAKYDNPHRMT